MASIFDSLRNLGRGLFSSVSEGAAHAVASFSERLERNSSLVYQQRGHLPRGQANRLAKQHLTGERAMSQIMRGMGLGSAYPTPWTQNRATQIASFHRWVYIAIDCIAARIAAMPPRLALVHPTEQSEHHRHGPVQKAIREARFRKSLHAVKPHEEIEEVGHAHPLARLLARPNAWTKSPGRLWYQAAMFLLLTGNHYQWIVPDRAFGRPLECWTIPSHWCWGPMIGPAGFKCYRIIPYMGGRGSFEIPADEIVHYAFDNPLFPLDGFSPTQAGGEWVDSAMYLDKSRTAAFQNGTQATGALELGPKYDPDDTDIEAIGAKFLARYQGVQSAGMPFILPPDVKMVPLTIAPKDMAYIESFPQMRDAVAALFRVPHEIMGISDAGSKVAFYGPMKQFNENAIFPLCRMIADVFTAEVCRRWDDALRFWWEDHSPDSPEETNAMLSLDLQNGVRSLNEARAERGLEPREEAWADELLIPQGKMPLSVAQKQQEQQEQQAKQQAQQQQAPPQQPGAPQDGDGQDAASGAPPGADPSQLAALAGGEQAVDLFDQAGAEDAALDANDQSWQDREGAVKKAHEYNAKAQAAGKSWRLDLDPTSQRWRAVTQKKNGDGRNGHLSNGRLVAPSANGHAATALLNRPRFTKAAVAKSPLIAAGLAVVADDTGRTLLLQRSLDDGQNGGKWEFPGGHIDGDEQPRDAAVREWQEETGLHLPDGRFAGGWNSGNGVYRGYAYRVPAESSLDLSDRHEGSNPDGDAFEALAWVDPVDFDNHNLRSELLADLGAVRPALRASKSTVVKSWTTEQAAKHPHAPAGGEHGGEFVSAHSGSGAAVSDAQRPKPEDYQQSGSGEKRAGTVAQEMARRAAIVGFSDEPFDPGASEIGSSDYDEIEERLTEDEREEMKTALADYRDDWVSEQMNEFSPEVDAQDIAEEAGYSQTDVRDRIKELIEKNTDEQEEEDRLLEELDDWYNETSEKRGSGDVGISLARRSLTGEPEELDAALREYESEAEEKIREAIEEEEKRQNDEQREELEDQYDDTDDRREWLRNFYDDNQERFANEIPNGEWHPAADGDEWWYQFETSSGNRFLVNVFDVNKHVRGYTDKQMTIPFQELQFKTEEGDFSITGGGNAHEVFGQVVPAVVAYVQHEQPPVLAFSAKEESRQRLYDRLVKSVSRVASDYAAIAVEVGDMPRWYALVKRDQKDEFTSKLSQMLDDKGAKIETLVKTLHPTIIKSWFAASGWNYLRKNWDRSKHPRGSNPKNPGQFSHGSGGAGNAVEATRPEPPPPRPDATQPHQPPVIPPTHSTGGKVRPQPFEYLTPKTPQPSSSADRSPVHKTMERAALKRADPLKGGANATSLLTLEDGTKAVFKTPSGESRDAGRDGVPHGTQYRREIAVSRVADALGFGDLVPPTTVREQGGEVGSAQAFVADAHKTSEVDEPFDGGEDAARAAVFDYLVGHLDRHRGNWLLKDGKLALIDNGLSFPDAYHADDFFNMEFWKHTQQEDLPMPDVSGLEGKWPAVEKELRDSGIEDTAIALAKARFSAVLSGVEYVAELPSLLGEEGGPTLGDMAQYYDRGARKDRHNAMVAERERVFLEGRKRAREARRAAAEELRREGGD